jgi:hypothetical protein
MKDKTQTILFVIFILIFFVVPPLLKLLGQYTLNSKKNRGENAEAQPAHEEISDMGKEERRPEVGTVTSENQGKPIKPRWF